MHDGFDGLLGVTLAIALGVLALHEAVTDHLCHGHCG
jgi:hypothetical protein